MKRMFKKWTGPVDGAMERLQRRFRRSRPGSVLIMVVALLVLLALMGTAYLATARQDRISAGRMHEDGVDAAAKQAAADALANAAAWLANDTQTFTTSAVFNPLAQLSESLASTASPPIFANSLIGPLIASRVPDLAPLGGVPYNPSNGPFTFPPQLTGGAMGATGSEQYAVRWPRVTVPPTYSRFASPIGSLNPGNGVNNFSYDAAHYYGFNDAEDWAAPTFMTITYPLDYAGTLSLRGQTRTYPAFMKYTYVPTSTTAGKTIRSGPFLAADAMGDGIADSGLVALDVPDVDGVKFFVAYRIVDNAAAINLNTAWGPNPYTGAMPAGVAANWDPRGNAFNFFPTDVDLYGFLNSAFNTNNTASVNGLPANASEMPTIQNRRVIPGATAGAEAYWTQARSDGGINHPDVDYLYRGEAMWWHLGRRLDNPLFGIAGDALDGSRRPFGDADTVALGFHGVMTDPTAAQSKIEQIFKTINPNNLVDSVYRGAMNYMANSQDRFSVLPANAVAYWYDWNFNFEGYTSGASMPSGLVDGLGIGFSGSMPTDGFYIANRFGNSNASAPPPYSALNAPGQAAFRDPRPLLVGSNPTLLIARAIDSADLPGPSQTVNVTGAPPAGGQLPVPMTKIAGNSQKVSLNTGGFADLWRAYANVFNDFDPEDGATPTTMTPNGVYKLHLQRDASGYDLRDKNGPNASPLTPTVTAAKPVCNPMQFRNVLRDPNLNDSTSDSVNTFTSPANAITGAAGRCWLDAHNMMALRAALAAVNTLTLRDQHGTMMDAANNYFAPNVNRQAIELDVATTANGAAHQTVAAYVYGGAPQPFITEVYVDNDTSDHGGKNNPNGIVMVKLYNPYPYALRLDNYDIAVIDRTGFTAPVGGMTVKLISRTAEPFPANTILAANDYVLLTNFDPDAAKNMYWPQIGGLANPPAAKVMLIPGLTDVIEGAAPVGAAAGMPGKGGEMLLLRPMAANVGSPNGLPNPAAPATPPNLTIAQVPVDSFDFHNMKVDPASQTFTAWHYLRMSGNATNPADPAALPGPAPKSVAWKCVYPGPYSGTGDFTAATKNNPPSAAAAVSTYAGAKPHFQNTDAVDWTPSGATATKNPWNKDTAIMGMDSTDTTNATPVFHLDLTYSKDSTYPNRFPGIQICNVDFGGFNKRDPSTGVATATAFPYGGFARVGDVLQVPFVGSYVIFPTNDMGSVQWPPVSPLVNANSTATVTEINPVTLDSDYADDGDLNDDGVEQVGRFVPIVNGTVNDLSPSGYYAPAQDTTAPVLSYLTGAWQNIVPSAWRYHFAQEIYNQFTVVASPGNDVFPNLNTDSWYTPPGYTPPAGSAATPLPVASTGWAGVEGLVNVNTANWRVLASVEMIPRSLDPTGQNNLELAKAIVYYRDVDDGLAHFTNGVTGGWTRDASTKWVWTNANPASVLAAPPTGYRRGHGPFNSLAELNNVYLGTAAPGNPGFQNALGMLTGADFSVEQVRHNWGYYTPAGKSVFGPPPVTNTLQSDDWLNQNLMVNRVSNLLTTRSDSFTVYVVVQGWRNAFALTDGTNPKGPWPELVVQKRMAMTVDRSTVTPTSKTVKTTLFPTK